MKKFLAIVAAAMLTACGGGGSGADNNADSANPGSTYTTEISLATDAPVNNLDLAPNAGYLTATAATQCGYPTPSKSLSGTVTSVHDGDTITVNGTSIRLESIDAPELAQSYGKQSRDNLASLVNGKVVTVYYAKLDKYGRTVGAVFTSDCVYANLRQVQTGSAWHYKEYQCEQTTAMRDMFAAAQLAAQEAGLGLWASPATAPWVYRNGVDPTPPTCSSTQQNWATGGSSPSSGGSGSASGGGSSAGSGSSSSASGCKLVWVNGYYRKNGTYVRGYYQTRCY